MMRLTRKLDGSVDADASVTLTFDQRIRSRLRVVLDDGREAGVFLERGAGLRSGDCLTDDEGLVVRVLAAAERVSSVRADDALQLARACYHLGNRHVPLQIERGRLRYLHDHVLDAMVRGLGLTVTVENAEFEPEPGAYGGPAQAHAHGGHPG